MVDLRTKTATEVVEQARKHAGAASKYAWVWLALALLLALCLSYGWEVFQRFVKDTFDEYEQIVMYGLPQGCH